MSVWNDIRISVRTLAKNRAFTIAAVLTVAIGIGSTTAIATVVDSILLRPLPYPHADRIVQIISYRREGAATIRSASFDTIKTTAASPSDGSPNSILLRAITAHLLEENPRPSGNLHAVVPEARDVTASQGTNGMEEERREARRNEHQARLPGKVDCRG
jgi:hypothetical protein